MEPNEDESEKELYEAYGYEIKPVNNSKKEGKGNEN